MIRKKVYLVSPNIGSTGIWRLTGFFRKNKELSYEDLNLPEYLTGQFKKWIEYFESGNYNHHRINYEGTYLSTSLQEHLGSEAAVFYHIV